MDSKSYESLLNVFEALAKSQINTIRQLKKKAGLLDEEQTTERRMSQIDMAYDILFHSKNEMHVNNIIIAVKKKFDVELDKESIVSALIKRVKRQDRFAKTAPNTFTLIDQI
jgi:hypothetical protein